MLRWLFAICIGYLGLLLLLFWFQERLLFFPRRISAERVESLRSRKNVDPLELQMSDGAMVRGWLVKNSFRQPLKLLFYYGGNAEELSSHIEDAGHFGDRSLVLVNYRGYGTSDGAPGEAAIIRDALKIFDAITKRPDVDASNVILMGRSLGTGVAVSVAAQRPPSGLILVSPYDSLTHVAKRHYPYAPVDLLLRHRFESIRLSPAITSPVLMLVAAEDSIVPKSHSRLLSDHWGGAVTYCEIANTDHNTIGLQPSYWSAIQQFLQSTNP